LASDRKGLESIREPPSAGKRMTVSITVL
jgi:hypothetical protein